MATTQHSTIDRKQGRATLHPGWISLRFIQAGYPSLLMLHEDAL
jgi:hypothetical protein